MVIGLLVLAAIPTVTGVSFATSEQRKARDRAKDEKWMRRFTCYVYCDSPSSRAKDLHGGRLVLRDGRVYICPPHAKTVNGYLGSFFYIEYPDPSRKPVQRGLVSQVRDDPPLLNWIYIDKGTMELRYGNRTASMEHYVGPWGWTKEDELGVTFEGEERFVAVEDPRKPGEWRVFCDAEDDLLKGWVDRGWRRLRVSLERVPEDVQATPGAEGGEKGAEGA